MALLAEWSGRDLGRAAARAGSPNLTWLPVAVALEHSGSHATRLLPVAPRGACGPGDDPDATGAVADGLGQEQLGRSSGDRPGRGVRDRLNSVPRAAAARPRRRPLAWSLPARSRPAHCSARRTRSLIFWPSTRLQSWRPRRPGSLGHANRRKGHGHVGRTPARLAASPAAGAGPRADRLAGRPGLQSVPPAAQSDPTLADLPTP
jgi:hypothetical protein